MKKKINFKAKKGSSYKPYKAIFLKTQLIMISADFILIFITSLITYYVSVDLNLYFYFIISAVSISAFGGGFYSGYKIHEKGLLTGFLFCLPMNIIICIVSLVINSFKTDITFLITMVIIFICSMLGGILSVNTRLKVKNNRKGKQV